MLHQCELKFVFNAASMRHQWELSFAPRRGVPCRCVPRNQHEINLKRMSSQCERMRHTCAFIVNSNRLQCEVNANTDETNAKTCSKRCEHNVKTPRNQCDINVNFMECTSNAMDNANTLWNRYETMRGQRCINAKSIRIPCGIIAQSMRTRYAINVNAMLRQCINS